MRAKPFKRACAGMVASGLVLALGACTPRESTAPRPFAFSILSNEESAVTSAAWRPVLDDLQAGLGMEIDAFFGPNYTALVEAMRFQQTDAGWFGAASALAAVERAGGEVFAVGVRPDGREGYEARMIVPAGAATTLDAVLRCDQTMDLAGSDPQSTSGTLAPLAFLYAPHGLDPQTCFKTRRTANHEANIRAVAAGLADVAIVDSAVFDRLAARAPETAAGVRVIWTSPRLAGDPLLMRANLPEAQKAALRGFFLGYGQGDSETAAAQRGKLAALNLGSFRPADDRHLDGARAMRAAGDLVDARASGDPAQIAAAEAALAAATQRAREYAN